MLIYAKKKLKKFEEMRCAFETEIFTIVWMGCNESKLGRPSFPDKFDFVSKARDSKAALQLLNNSPFFFDVCMEDKIALSRSATAVQSEEFLKVQKKFAFLLGGIRFVLDTQDEDNLQLATVVAERFDIYGQENFLVSPVHQNHSTGFSSYSPSPISTEIRKTPTTQLSPTPSSRIWRLSFNEADLDGNVDLRPQKLCEPTSCTYMFSLANVTLSPQTILLLQSRAMFHNVFFERYFPDFPKDFASFRAGVDFCFLSQLGTKEGFVYMILEGEVNFRVTLVRSEKEEHSYFMGPCPVGKLLPSLRKNLQDSGVKLVYEVKKPGVALCVDMHRFQQMLLPKMSHAVRSQFDEEFESKGVEQFKSCFPHWFLYLRPHLSEILIDLCTHVVLQEGQLLSSDLLANHVVFVRSGALRLSHTPKRKLGPDRFSWTEEASIREAGEVLFTSQALETLFLNSSLVNDSSDLEADSPLVECHAIAGNTTAWIVPTLALRMLFELEPTFQADWELHMLKELTRLDAILAHPVALHCFKQHLIDTQAIENLDFWLEVQHFPKTQAEAQHIYSQYVQQDADKEINLPSDKRSALDLAISQGHFHQEIFLPASLECFSLLQSCCLPQFVKTQRFQQLLKDVSVGKSLDEVLNPPPVTSEATVSLSATENFTKRNSRQQRHHDSFSWRFRGLSDLKSSEFSPRLSFSRKSLVPPPLTAAEAPPSSAEESRKRCFSIDNSPSPTSPIRKLISPKSFEKRTASFRLSSDKQGMTKLDG